MNLEVRYFAFQFQDRDGSFLSARPDFRYRFSPAFLIQASMPAARMSFQDEVQYGFQNPLILGQYAILHRHETSLEVGAQLEFPVGSHSAGIASDHFMVMPFVTWTLRGEKHFYSGQIGFAQALSFGHHDHDVEPSHQYVLPHEDREISMRLTGGTSLLGDRMGAEAFLHGQYVLVEEREQVSQDLDLSSGMALTWNLSRHLSLQPMAEVSLLSQGRFAWNSGMSLLLRRF